MKQLPTQETAEAVIALGKLVLDFSKIERATAHEDGTTAESDADHTVMLGVIACAVAHRYEPGLDVGKVAQFALVHDLVEVYAGDTNTFGIHFSTKDLDKESREAAALARIAAEFGSTLPWVHETIEEYESLKSPEARFIKTLDKVLPKITNVINHGMRLRLRGEADEFSAFCARQLEHLRASYGSDQEAALTLYQFLVTAVEAELSSDPTPQAS